MYTRLVCVSSIVVVDYTVLSGRSLDYVCSCSFGLLLTYCSIFLARRINMYSLVLLEYICSWIGGTEKTMKYTCS